LLFGVAGFYRQRENSCLGQPMRHSFSQRGIDAGLPPLPGGLEGFQNIGIHSHVQGRSLDGSSRPASPSLDAGLLPISGHGISIVGVVGAISGVVCNGRVLGGFTPDTCPIGCGGFSGCFGHTASFLVWMRGAEIWTALRWVHASHTPALPLQAQPSPFLRWGRPRSAILYHTAMNLRKSVLVHPHIQ